MSGAKYPVVGVRLPTGEMLRRLATAVTTLRDGRINATGSFTLTASSATTTVNDVRAHQQSIMLWMPKTANAAAALGGLYVSARATGSVTLTHANNAQTDRDFEYVLLG